MKKSLLIVAAVLALVANTAWATPRTIVLVVSRMTCAINDIGSAEDFLAAIEGTIKNFNDGDLVSGIVVQIDRSRRGTP